MRLLRPGDPVVLISTGECGVVVHTWESERAVATDEVAGRVRSRLPLYAAVEENIRHAKLFDDNAAVGLA